MLILGLSGVAITLSMNTEHSTSVLEHAVVVCNKITLNKLLGASFHPITQHDRLSVVFHCSSFEKRVLSNIEKRYALVKYQYRFHDQGSLVSFGCLVS